MLMPAELDSKAPSGPLEADTHKVKLKVLDPKLSRLYVGFRAIYRVFMGIMEKNMEATA